MTRRSDQLPKVVWLFVLAGLAAVAHADRFAYNWGIVVDESVAKVDPEIQPDGEGNVYVALKSKTRGADLSVPYYVRKYGPDGALLWQRDLITYEHDASVGAMNVIPGADGAVYLEGIFDEEITFDPNGTPVTMVGFDTTPPPGDTKPYMDRYVAKLTGDGDFVWMAVFGTRQPEPTKSVPRQMTIDEAGNVYYWSVIDWDVGPPARNLLFAHTDNAGVQTLSNPERHTFLLKLDANGQIVWHKTFNGYFDTLGLVLRNMHFDAEGRLIMLGGYSSANGSLDFDPGPATVTREFTYAGTYKNTWDAMVFRMTPEGEFSNLGVMSTRGPDYTYDYGRDDSGGEHILVYKVTDTVQNPLLYTPGTASTETGDDSFEPYGDGPGLGVIRLAADGSFIDTRPIPALPSRQGGAYTTLPYTTVTKRPIRMPVNGRGEYFVKYIDASSESHPPDIYSIAKFDSDLNLRWRADFNILGSVSVNEPYAWIGADDAVYLGTRIEFEIDLDPTDGTDMFAPTPGLSLYVIGKITDVQTPDVVSITRVDADPTNAATVQFLVTFDEPVTGVDATDFALTTSGTVTGASVAGVTGADTEWTVTVGTGSGDGTIRLDLIDDDSILGAFGDTLGTADAGDGGFITGQTYTIDRTGPVAAFSLAGSSYTITYTMEVLVTFDEAVTGVDASDFTVSNGVVTGVSGSGTDYVVTIHITTPGDASIDLASGGLVDGPGNGNGAAMGLTVTWLDFNGDPSVPGPVGWALICVVCLACALGIRELQQNYATYKQE